MKREPKTARAFQDRFSEEPSLAAENAAFKLSYRYKTFANLDGSHPWQDAVPDSCVMYPVREIEGGKVSFFNFELAKEMGLIAESHPNVMNPKLEETLLQTFAIRIVNEYDQASGRKIKGLKPKKFMATRYLQLQHEDKRGRTSGDGRGIWNGAIRHHGKTWDVSSRGTGVTCLAPGAVEAGKPLKTGATDFGYGCGLADIDELYGSAIMSEIFHRQGIPTERVLCIIDTGKKQGIGVRAHQNLIRPAHLFRYLKLGDYKNLRRSIDYFIQRQVQNGKWAIPVAGQARYMALCQKVSESFAKLAARLDVDYIFVWLDWDGDNILADGSIIDYGSVRQFGLRHDQYRYDDVDRFSTNLNEQKLKARQIVQTFVQAADFLRTGSKKPVETFANHEILKTFDRVFETARKEHLGYRIGLQDSAVKKLLSRHHDYFDSFESEFSYFERAKTTKPTEKVPDGVNRPAIFNMRTLLRQLPLLLHKNEGVPLTSEELFDLVLSTSAPRQDKKMTDLQGEKLQHIQLAYLELLDRVRGRRSRMRFLKEVAARSAVINKSDRITGNSITVVVDELMKKIAKGLNTHETQIIIDTFVGSQILVPEFYAPSRSMIPKHPKSRSLMKTLLQVVEELREDI